MREIWKRKHERDPGETTVHVDYFTADNFHMTVLKNKDRVNEIIPTITMVMKSDSIETLDDSLELGSLLM